MTTATKFDFNAWHLANRKDDGRSTASPHIRELLENHWMVPWIECVDGFKMSVQASEYHYCEPRQTAAHPYTCVEVGFPSERVGALMPYIDGADSDPTGTVYAWVPVEIVNELVDAHGGQKVTPDA